MRYLLFLFLCLSASGQLFDPMLNLSIPVAAGAGNTPTYVQGKGVASAVNNAAATFDSTPANGNRIIVGVAAYGYSPVNGDVTDNKGNTYVRKHIQSYDNSNVAFFITTNAYSTATFTVTFAHDNTYPGIAITEWSDTIDIDTTAGNDNTSTTTPSAGSITANKAVLSMTCSVAGGTPTITAGAWATGVVGENEDGNNYAQFNCAYKSTGGSVTPTWTYGSAMTAAAASVSIR